MEHKRGRLHQPRHPGSERKKSLLQKRQKLLEGIRRYADFIKGSVTKVSRQGRSSGGYHLTFKDENQKTHTTYVSLRDLKRVQKSIKNMIIVRKITNHVSRLNVELLRVE